MGVFEVIRDVDVCSKCGGDKISCIDSRNYKGTRKRTKVCKDCGMKITTIEIDERDVAVVNSKMTILSEKVDHFIYSLRELARYVDDGK